MESNDKHEILRLLSEGKLTASEAVELLDRLSNPSGRQEPVMDDTIVVEKAPPISELSAVDYPAPEPFKIKVTEDDLAVANLKGETPRWLKIRVSE